VAGTPGIAAWATSSVGEDGRRARRECAHDEERDDDSLDLVHLFTSCFGAEE
jgi:hypothetical protein